MAHTFDIAVLGANAGGYAAAHYLASQKLSVAVIDSPREPVECPLSEWVPAEFFKQPHLPKALAKAAGAEEFNEVVFHNSTLEQEAPYHARKVAGYFLPTGMLTQALAAAAVKAGAKVKTTTTSPAIRLEEDGVDILGSCQVRTNLLIISQNRPEDIISELSLPVRNVPQSPIVAAGLDIPLPAKMPLKHLAGAMHVVQSTQRGDLAMFFLAGENVHIRVIRAVDSPEAHVARLSTLVGALQRANILPATLPLAKAKGAVWHPPAGVALELDTHVAKRCLLTGTAGGFADCITGATLMPTVRSCLLAAEEAAAALGSPDPQDRLMHFKTSWRRHLAEFLRPPNTSLAMLMPLLFVNNKIVAKFADALLHGESI